MRVRSGVVLAGVVLGGVVLAACGSPSPGKARSDPAGTSPPQPASVSVVWNPGMNRGHRHEPVTTGGAALAARLAHDVHTAVPFAPGVYNCPADFGRSARLTFTYADRTERVTVTLTGCPSLRIPGDRRRLQGGQVATDLAPITPPDLRRG